MKPDISFIFVNFRSVNLLRSALSSVYQAALGQGILAEYIVVNNDKDEAEPINRLRTHPASPNVIQAASNGGFGRANNSGAEMASGEVLFFINPDAVLRSGSFLGLLAAFRFQPKALYGMALVGETGRREPWSSGKFPSLWRLLISRIVPWMYPVPIPWQAKYICKTGWVSGAACALRRDFFQSLQGFDEAFFLYFEDVDLARRVTEAGGSVSVYPFITFWHKGGQSHSSFWEKKEAYYAGQREYFRKWRPNYERAILSLCQRIKSLLLPL